MQQNYIHLSLPAIASLGQLQAHTKNDLGSQIVCGRHEEADPYVRFDFTNYKNAIMVDIMQKRVDKMK